MEESEIDRITGHTDTDSFNEVLSVLREEHLVKPAGSSSFRISLKGRAYIEQRRRDTRYFVVPYVITTLIAVSSLLITILTN